MKSHQLLIVAWLPEIKNSVERILQSNKYLYDSVASPLEAIDAVGKYAYKVVIVDGLLPGLNGYQLVKRLKNTPHGEYAKFVVIMSNIPADREESVNKRWGLHSLLRKPVSEQELMSLLESAEAYDLPSEKLEMQTADSAEELFSDLAHGLWTGKTTCYGKGGVIKEIYWDGGNPVFAMSNDDKERLDKWLSNKGLVTESVLASAYDIMNKTGKRLGDSLIMLEAIGEDALERAVSDNMKAIIADVFSWGRIEYTKEEKNGGIKEMTSIKEPFPVILFEGIKRNTDADSIKKKLEDLGAVVSFTPDNIFNIEDFQFPQSFNRLMSLINGKRSMYELISKSGLPHDDAYRFLYTLFLLRLIKFSAANKAEKTVFMSMPGQQGGTGRATTFIGNLRDISVGELIQMLELNRKSGTLQIYDTNEIGWLLFDKGKLVDAYYGDLMRENAVYRILLLTEGEFDIKFKDIVGEHRIDMDTQTLLMEGLRMLDEIKRLEPVFGNFKKKLVVNPSHRFNADEEREELARIFNGKNDILTSSFLLNADPQAGMDIMSTLLKNNVIKEGT